MPMCCVQQRYCLGDARMEEELIELAVVPSFAGIDLLQGSVAEESTILVFRHLLEEKNLAETMFKMVKEHLASRAFDTAGNHRYCHHDQRSQFYKE